MRTSKDVLATSAVRFGTSGARGLVVDLDDTVCFAYTLAFLKAIDAVPPGRVALGLDLRPSSPRIATACAAAIRHAGLDVDYCGAIPTPALAHHAALHGMPALMVTGSHIPFDRNGIKFYRPQGEISKADEHAIIQASALLPDTISPHPLPAQNPAAKAGYLARYLDFFPAQALAGMRLGFYEHSSLAREVLREILAGLGAEVVSLGRTDAFVPIDTEAVGEEDVRRAHAWSAEHQFDALFSTDGDADRPLLGDEQGHWLRGDVVGILCARALGANAVATPVSSNTALEACGAFTRIARTRIGSPYVIDGMQTLIAAGHTHVVGYEANGGFLVGTPLRREGCELAPLPTRDAALPIIALLVDARTRGIPLSRLADDLPPRFTASDRLRDFATQRSAALLGELARSPSARAALLGDLCGAPLTLNETDGLRMTAANGEIVHLRPSGNAPELRCYAEAASPERAETLARACLTRLVNTPQAPDA